MDWHSYKIATLFRKIFLLMVQPLPKPPIKSKVPKPNLTKIFQILRHPYLHQKPATHPKTHKKPNPPLIPIYNPSYK